MYYIKMQIIYVLFDVPMLLVAPVEKRASKQKRTFSGAIEINPKIIKYNF